MYQEYYTDGGCPKLLLEPQSTNLITYSEDFSDASWTKLSGGTGSLPVVTSNQVNSPKGTLTADKIVLDKGVSTSNSDFSIIRSNYGGIDINGTASVYLKSDTNVEVEISANDIDYITVSVTTEWQRFTVSNATSDRVSIGLRGTEPSNNMVTIYAWGAQLEEQSYTTSYIPTSGATATRVAETLSKTGLSSYINSQEGVLYAEIKHLDISGTFRLLQLSDATQDNRVALYFNGTNGFVGSFINSNSIEQYSYLSSTNASNFTKLAITYSANKVATFINGVKVNEQLSTINTPLNLSKLDFSGSGNFFFYGKTKALKVYNQALTDLELEEMTGFKSFIQMANHLNYTVI